MDRLGKMLIPGLIMLAALYGAVARLAQPSLTARDLPGVEHCQFVARNQVIDFRDPVAIPGNPVGNGSELPRYQSFRLGEGWGRAGEWGVWALGQGSALELFLPRGDHRTLLLECRSCPGLGKDQPQTMSVKINGVATGTLDLRRSWGWYRLDLDPGLVRKGANQIGFSFSAWISPQAVGRGQDSRQLAVGFRKLALLAKPGATPRNVRRLADSPQWESGSAQMSQSGTLLMPINLESEAEMIEFEYFFGGPKTPPARCLVSLQPVSGNRGPTDELRLYSRRKWCRASLATDGLSGPCFLSLDLTAGRGQSFEFAEPRLLVRAMK